MSVLGKILKIGGAGLGIAAMPFTGGASAAAIPWLTAGSLGAGALGSALDRSKPSGGSPWPMTPYPSPVAQQGAGTPKTGGGVPWWQVGQLAAGSLGDIYASRSQSGSNRQALAAQERSDARAQQIAAENRAEMKRQFDMQQAQLKAQWDADQKFQAAKWGASEEERLYARRLLDEREARRAPYRAASEAALARLPGILESGRTSPGLGSLGSYRR